MSQSDRAASTATEMVVRWLLISAHEGCNCGAVRLEVSAGCRRQLPPLQAYGLAPPPQGRHKLHLRAPRVAQRASVEPERHHRFSQDWYAGSIPAASILRFNPALTDPSRLL